MTIDSLVINNIQFDTLQEIIPSNPVEAYMISLDDNVYNEGIKKIKLDIPIKKFDAVRGSTLIEYAKNTKNVSIRGQTALSSKYRDSSCDLTNVNSIGCYLSHVTLWYKIITDNLKGMYIFETDANCLKELDITEFLKTDGDILLFGCWLVGDSFFELTNYKRPIGLSKLNQSFYQTHAYYITYKGALNALKYVFPIEAQIDSYMSYLLKLNIINIYSYYPNVCIQSYHGSTIQSKPVKHYVDSILTTFVISMFFIIIIIVLSVMYVKKPKCF